MNTDQVVSDNFIISTDKQKLQIEIIHEYLCTQSYWAKNISLSTVKRSIEGSVCFGLYDQDKQVGFARVITDGATFGYLADVFILKEYRGKGLAKWMLQEILAYKAFQNFRRWMLATKDAHRLYEQVGFKALSKPERFMQYNTFDEYPVSQ